MGVGKPRLQDGKKICCSLEVSGAKVTGSLSAWQGQRCWPYLPWTLQCPGGIVSWEPLFGFSATQTADCHTQDDLTQQAPSLMVLKLHKRHAHHTKHSHTPFTYHTQSHIHSHRYTSHTYTLIHKHTPQSHTHHTHTHITYTPLTSHTAYSYTPHKHTHTIIYTHAYITHTHSSTTLTNTRIPHSHTHYT